MKGMSVCQLHVKAQRANDKPSRTEIYRGHWEGGQREQSALKNESNQIRALTKK